MDVRKTVFTKDIIVADEMGRPCQPITRAVAMGRCPEPFAGLDRDDLSQLFDVGAKLGQSLAAELVKMLEGPPICYNTAALEGASGAMEHGAAMLHPRFANLCAPLLGRQILDAVKPQSWTIGRRY